jgi:hypothetical protein
MPESEIQKDLDGRRIDNVKKYLLELRKQFGYHYLLTHCTGCEPLE